ncbi:unnamed protein product [Adineta steineri]|uniref:Pentacotripeptide-repeat region of PRORP domain-containing protein n=1 Tax=Adineta steineri TaxID=433720 RepID=A0A815FAG1_9BILA|nr:unnamed protein product [Adineta steineri]CAF3791641.1 unnamed protein product [Adineta steineri]
MFLRFTIRCRCFYSTLIDINNRLKQLNMNKQYKKVIDLFDNYIQKNNPSDLVINQTLKACIELGDIKRGSSIYQRLSSQSKQNHFIQTNLIRLFMKSGDINKAKEIFNKSQNKTLFMYNTMINGLSNNNHGKEAINLFREMSISPNEYTYTILFKSCSQLNDSQSIEFGKDLFENLPIQYQNHSIVLNSALHMLMQHGNIKLGEKLFSKINKDTTSYGVMMSGYLKNKQIEKTIDLFFQINKPNDINLIIFFNACAELGNEKVLHSILNMFSKLNRNEMTYGLMMNMYNKRNEPKQTLNLYEEMKREKIQPNEQISIFILNAFFQLNYFIKAEEFFNQIPNKSSMMYDVVLNGLANHNRAEQAFDLFQQMSIPPNEYTLSILFKICSQLSNTRSLEFAKKILNAMPEKYQSNTIILNSVLHMLMQYGDLLFAEKIFSQMNKDTISYGVMMSGYLKNNRPEEVIDIFMKLNNQMDEINLLIFFSACAELGNEKGLKLGKQIYSKLLSNRKLFSEKVVHSILNMFSKCSDIENAEKLFQKLNKNTISYECMMTMYNNQNEPDKTFNLYEEMKRDKIEIDNLIWILILNALAELTDLSTCESISSELPEKFYNDIQIQNALINMWGKASSVDRAKKIFHQIIKPNNMSYSTMINAYGFNGLGREAVQLYYEIPFEIIDDIINLCVLNACSHASLINEAQKIFKNISIDKRTEKIYTTMIDCFSRSNLVNEAEELINEYEQSHLPSYSMYMSILSAARNQRNPLLAQKMYDRIEPYLKDQEIYSTSAKVLLANTYALARDFTTASNIRMKMN